MIFHKRGPERGYRTSNYSKNKKGQSLPGRRFRSVVDLGKNQVFRRGGWDEMKMENLALLSSVKSIFIKKKGFLGQPGVVRGVVG